MSKAFIKKAAVFTLLIFIFMAISADYSFAQDVEINELIKKAEASYNEGDYNSALEKVNKVISTYSGERETHRNRLCSAYLIKAKIYYESGDNIEDNIEVEAALRKLFEIDIDYDLRKEEPDFFKKAKEIQEIVKRENENKEKERITQKSERIKQEAERKGLEVEKADAEKNKKEEEQEAQERKEKENKIVKEGQKKKKKKFPVIVVALGVGLAIAFTATVFLKK